MENLYLKLLNVALKGLDRPAVLYYRSGQKTETITYGTMLRMADEFAEHLRECQVAPGCRVALCSENSLFWHSAFLAITKIGAVPALADASLPEPELRRLFEMSETVALLASPSVCQRLMQAETPPVYPIFELGTELSHVNDVALAPPSLNPCNPATMAIFFSSGTTATAKAVEVESDGFDRLMEVVIKDFKFGAKDYHLQILPCYHIYGFMTALLALYTSAPVCLTAKVSDISTAITDFRPTVLFAIPKLLETFKSKIEKNVAAQSPLKKALFNMMFGFNRFMVKAFRLNLGKLFFAQIHKAFGSRIKFLGSGGSILDAETSHYLLTLGFPVTIGYGLTEAGVPVAVNRPRSFKHGAIGRAFTCSAIRIENPDENGLGEIVVKTLSVMKGYLNDLALTKTVMTEDGYIKTGDMGYIKKGILYMTGRIKEAIVLSNGKKASPNDIEGYYKDVENVKELTVVGVPQEGGKFDKIAGIFVLLNNDLADATIQKIKEITSTLPSHMKMTLVRLASDIPKTSIGKPKRVLIRNMLMENEENTTF